MNGIPTGAFTWSAAGAWATCFTLIGLIIRQVGPWRKQSIDAEQAFRDGLLARIEAQDERIGSLEDQLAAERASRAAEVSILRHENNNLSQIITMFIALIEASPEKAAAHAARIRSEMEKGAARIATEKAAIRSAEIIATHGRRSATDPSPEQGAQS